MTLNVSIGPLVFSRLVIKPRKLLAAIVLASGCSTTPIPLSQTAPVPQERVIYRATPTPSAAIIVIRDTGGAPTIAPREILLDGQLAGVVMKGERLTLNVSPGEHLVSSRQPRGLDSSIKTAAVMAEAGKTYYFRAGLSQGGEHTMNRGTENN